MKFARNFCFIVLFAPVVIGRWYWFLGRLVLVLREVLSCDWSLVLVLREVGIGSLRSS